MPPRKLSYRTRPQDDLIIRANVLYVSTPELNRLPRPLILSNSPAAVEVAKRETRLWVSAAFLARVQVHGATGERLLLGIPIESVVNATRTVLSGQEIDAG
jgi:hypothetical protein